MTLAVDSETFLITRSMPAPQSVCWSWSDSDTLLVPWEGPSPYERFRVAFDRGDVLCGHNFMFDLAILAVEDRSLLPRIFDGLETGQLRCTMIREQLIRISRGEGRFVTVADDEDDDRTERTRFDLGSTAWRWLRHFVNKKEKWRKKYGTLYGVPLRDWPADAIAYAVGDAAVTKRVYDAQQGYIDYYHKGSLPDEIPQHTYAWALKLVSLWGVRTEREAVARLKEKLTKRQADAIAALLPAGIFRVDGTKKAPKYVKTMKTIREKVAGAYAELGEPVPLTKKGAVSTATKTLREAGAKDASLTTLADALGAMKLLSSFIPVLESGTEAPICADYNVLVESGRTSCRNPNMQQLPRGLVEKDAKGNVTATYYPREAFISREGMALVSVDYEMAELVGQGQMALDLVGFSILAEELNAGKKPVMAFAADMAGVTYEQATQIYADKSHPAHGDIKGKRQRSKGVVYGAAGYMRAKRLLMLLQEEDPNATLMDAKTMLDGWERRYTEFPRVFDYVKSQIGWEFGDIGTITQLRSGRIRGGVDLPAAANSLFQGLVADAAKDALKDVVRECYMVPSSPLFGSRPVVFAHDEIIIECQLSHVHDVGYRLAEVMKTAAARWMPDVKMGAEPAAMMVWKKDAPSKFNAEGKLVPCDLHV